MPWKRFSRRVKKTLGFGNRGHYEVAKETNAHLAKFTKRVSTIPEPLHASSGVTPECSSVQGTSRLDAASVKITKNVTEKALKEPKGVISKTDLVAVQGGLNSNQEEPKVSRPTDLGKSSPAKDKEIIDNIESFDGDVNRTIVDKGVEQPSSVDYAGSSRFSGLSGHSTSGCSSGAYSPEGAPSTPLEGATALPVGGATALPIDISEEIEPLEPDYVTHPTRRTVKPSLLPTTPPEDDPGYETLDETLKKVRLLNQSKDSAMSSKTNKMAAAGVTSDGSNVDGVVQVNEIINENSAPNSKSVDQKGIDETQDLQSSRDSGIDNIGAAAVTLTNALTNGTSVPNMVTNNSSQDSGAICEEDLYSVVKTRGSTPDRTVVQKTEITKSSSEETDDITSDAPPLPSRNYDEEDIPSLQCMSDDKSSLASASLKTETLGNASSTESSVPSTSTGSSTRSVCDNNKDSKLAGRQDGALRAEPRKDNDIIREDNHKNDRFQNEAIMDALSTSRDSTENEAVFVHGGMNGSLHDQSDTTVGSRNSTGKRDSTSDAAVSGCTDILQNRNVTEDPEPTDLSTSSTRESRRDSREETRNSDGTNFMTSSQFDFIDSMRQLKECGWYWGPLSATEAEAKLANKPDGSFLVRDSSDERYILSLSFNSQGNTHHTRIEHYKGFFSFYSQPSSHGYSKITEFIERIMEHSRNGSFSYFLRPSSPGSPPMQVQLLYPVSRLRMMRSLQHMCRFLLLKHIRIDHIEGLPLPNRIRDYLKEKQYYIEFLED